jgi:AraC-like DNA-binding protein
MIATRQAFEAPAWSGIDGEWRTLFGSFYEDGVSIEWHDFQCANRLNWARSFHPDSLEICLNLEGKGNFKSGRSQTRLSAQREAGERHRFITVELSREWLAEAVRGNEEALNVQTRQFLDGITASRTTIDVRPLSPHVRQFSQEVLKPPVEGRAAKLWFRAKIIELASLTLMEPEKELFCQRLHRLTSDRVQRVKDILARDLEQPPTLADLGKEVGCSPFYLSRIFSEETGLTISRYLRNVRLERAAELLRGGKCNVTEAAMAVGYSSLSHFSKAFAEMYGSCPCVFPLAKS